MLNYDNARNLAINFFMGFRTQHVDNIAYEMASAKAAEFWCQSLGMSLEILKEELVKDLRESYSTTVTVQSLLKAPGHKPWIKAKKSGQRWPLWRRYERYLLEHKKWSPAVVQSLDETTDIILDNLEDPTLSQPTFERRGIVVGYVQSGKTANFTGLINKAFDAGYKLVIVLTGMHNSLRSQTQLRLDEEVLGYETSRDVIRQKVDNTLIGVSTLEGEHFINILSLTSRDDKGDFNRAIARGSSVHPGAAPFLLVVKKNKSVLTNILKYFRDDSPLSTFNTELNRKTIKNTPLLIIDDEADQASINTANVVVEEGEDPEEPTTINKLLRQIYRTFEKRAYVGYTATPFANIFIDNKVVHPEYGPELFPKDFILSLPKPSNYIGPDEVFNLSGDKDESLAVVRPVDYEEKFIKFKHTKDHNVRELPDSLIKAIHSFVLSTTIRRLRGQANVHNSMLIHVTRFKDVQSQVYELTKKYMYSLQQRLRRGESGNNEVLNQIHEVYLKDFITTTTQINTVLKQENVIADWDSIKANLMISTDSIVIKKINGTSKDILDYKDHDGIGLNIIAIGGDKLSRGLTLEGLTISYYLRPSSMYDTLMQMGRWFGYRNGYVDLCRIYTTNELISWFQHISKAFEELRDELQYMDMHHKTPEEFGLKVQTHPIMDITSQIKMRSSQEQRLSYSTLVTETTVFDLDNEKMKRNFDATERFISTLGPHKQLKEDGHYFFSNVDNLKVLEYLSLYETAKTAPRANSKNIMKYIQKANQFSELTDWKVIVLNIGKQNGLTLNNLPFGNGIKRRAHNEGRRGYLSIKRLLSGDHEFLDFTVDEDAKDKLKNVREAIEQLDELRKGVKSKEMRARLRTAKEGLLLIYIIDKWDEEDKNEWTNITNTPVGWGFVFPRTEHEEILVDYRVNKVFIEVGEEDAEYVEYVD